MAQVKLDLRFDRGAFARLADFFKTRSHKAKPKVMEAVARRTAEIVREEYKTPPEDLRTELTRQIYNQGKSEGHTPERYTYPDASPLRRSNAQSSLAGAVQAFRISPDHWTVRINPSATQTGGDPGDRGKPLAAIAAQLEAPRPAVARLTARMAAYLHLLARGEAGQASTRAFRGDPNALVGAQFIIVNPRKSWGVWDRARRRALKELGATALSEMKLVYKVPRI